MAVTKATVPDRLADTLIIDTSADNTAEDNVFDGSVALYTVQIDNTNNPTAVYVKAANATSIIPASNNPDYMFYAAGNQKLSYVIYAGMTLSSGFSFWGTTTQANATAQTSPDPAPTVKLLGQ
jgi:hypothetical protein